MPGLTNACFCGDIITLAMLCHGFPLPIWNDMEKILLYYEVSPLQLPLLVILVYKRAKIQEKVFPKKSVNKEIVVLIEVFERQGRSYPPYYA